MSMLTRTSAVNRIRKGKRKEHNNYLKNTSS